MGGTGLGLSIVKHVVNYYNGSIELDSRIMEGSKFTVRLPKKFNKEKRVE
jgi:two-component system phosphate regulon sensor histidine kinase PhoR